MIQGDLHDPAALAALCADAQVVIHGAAIVKARIAGEFQRVNVDGARRLAEAARGPVMLISSLAAREPGLSPYAASKRAAETAMAEVLGARLTVVRPPAIYGPADRELLPLFQAAAVSPILPLLSPGARLAVIHVEDAARQIAALAARPTGGIWALSDDRPDGYSWSEVMTEAAAACGRSPRLMAIPAGVVRGVGGLGDLAAALGGNPMLTSGKTRELLHPDWTLGAGERAPGLPPCAYPLPKGFAHTVAWYRSASWMKH